MTSGDAPAYCSAECGGRTYVGSYTLMMDWAQCRDYCTYFPHAAELGHTFSFADILDADTMECLRYNMNNQYTPSTMGTLATTGLVATGEEMASTGGTPEQFLTLMTLLVTLERIPTST